MIPRHGRPPRRGIGYRLRPGVYAVLRARTPTGSRGVLLTEQTTRSFVEMQLPGGGIEAGEHALPALIREVMEETGHGARLIGRLGSYREFTFMEEYGIHAEKICHVYLGQAGPRRGLPGEPGHRAVVVPVRRAVDLVGPAGQRRLLARARATGLI